MKTVELREDQWQDVLECISLAVEDYDNMRRATTGREADEKEWQGARCAAIWNNISKQVDAK